MHSHNSSPSAAARKMTAAHHCLHNTFTSVLLYYRDALRYIRTYISTYVCTVGVGQSCTDVHFVCSLPPNHMLCSTHCSRHIHTIHTYLFVKYDNPKTPTRTSHSKTLSPFYCPIHSPPSPLPSPHTRVVLPHLVALHNKAFHIVKEGIPCVDNNLAVKLSQDLSDLSHHCTSTHTHTRRDKGSNMYSDTDSYRKFKSTQLQCSVGSSAGCCIKHRQGFQSIFYPV